MLVVAYADCPSEAEMIATYEEQARLMHERGTPTLVLSDFTGSSIGSAFMKRVNEGSKAYGAELLERDALVGVTGLKTILLDGYLSVTGLKDRVRTFDDRADALAWLVE